VSQQGFQYELLIESIWSHPRGSWNRRTLPALRGVIATLKFIAEIISPRPKQRLVGFLVHKHEQKGPILHDHAPRWNAKPRARPPIRVIARRTSLAPCLLFNPIDFAVINGMSADVIESIGRTHQMIENVSGRRMKYASSLSSMHDSNIQSHANRHHAGEYWNGTKPRKTRCRKPI